MPLPNDILRQLKRPGAICLNDAKSCYDLIGHTQALISMQPQGVPTSVVMIVCLRLCRMLNAKLGLDTEIQTITMETLPMHGITQGNGAGPAKWVVVSSPLLNMLRSKGLGCSFTVPVSGIKVNIVGYSFVDDTDLMQTLPSGSIYEEVLSMIQKSIDTWEGR